MTLMTLENLYYIILKFINPFTDDKISLNDKNNPTGVKKMLSWVFKLEL